MNRKNKTTDRMGSIVPPKSHQQVFFVVVGQNLPHANAIHAMKKKKNGVVTWIFEMWFLLVMMMQPSPEEEQLLQSLLPQFGFPSPHKKMQQAKTAREIFLPSVDQLRTTITHNNKQKDSFIS
jgi:hypothetical protein